MASEIAERFMNALQEMEETGEVTLVTKLFAEGAELSRATSGDAGRKAEEPEPFWREYLSTFQEIHSEFTRVTEQDGRSVLEWISEGSLENGDPIRYAGVSILETEDGAIQSFRTYYDSAVFHLEGNKNA